MSLLTDLSTKCELQAMNILALRKQVRELETENAELRKLAMDSVRYAEPEFHIGLKYNVFCTSECQLRDSVCPNSDECKYPAYLHERLRELGIEADE